MSDSDDIAEAAAEAAWEAIEQSSWPPTRDDADRIGASAGTAAGAGACIAMGAERVAAICGRIGEKVGAWVGKAIYDVADYIFGGVEQETPYQKWRRGLIAFNTLTDEVSAQQNADQYDTVARLLTIRLGRPVRIRADSRDGLPADTSAYYSFEGKQELYALVVYGYRNWQFVANQLTGGRPLSSTDSAIVIRAYEESTKSLIAAEAARTAYLVTKQELGDTEDSGIGVIVPMAIIGGIGWIYWASRR